ncbi:MAG: hypothetical protein P1U65_15815 [Minwuia sp.]|nr:hypothetical protein [Minwuia sp.]
MAQQFPNLNQQGGGAGGNDGPPGQNMLGIALAAAAAMLGTPLLFHYIGPMSERLIYEAYGIREFASLMYYASFALCGLVIYAACRIALWYAISALIAFLTLRFGNTLSMGGL